ncbi:TnsA endonuclease N-terminal domain-containing protein [Virgibacillus dakarensis]|uniref:TnsA endonuclease N-terminal domain-containing protein n=1 Tax=Cytobacillus kochii TaxID=859143 RepID=UPI000C835475|nr:TnsA endonuclease N-terminal domain-containing protein [Cytobacillus kochii]MBT2217992.1 TnsA endonuclease N-terminal domain-containing protein [Virgibacillus dakarensis]MCA1025042.1 TnsA endonuclease N-terminal domain-containing protein [Cytobacillus kochii]
MGANNWSKEKLNRYLKEGRGQGVGKDYLPWNYTYNYSSKGRVSRISGLKTRRIHHLHSDNQYRAFLLFEFNSNVADIRESFPLLDVEEVIDDKEDLRFDKFIDRETKEPYVLTTNFLLTVKDVNGEQKGLARTVKNTTELKRKITFEKLEIERRYWNQKGIDWKVMTEKQLPRQLAKNIEWVRETLLEWSEGELNKSEQSILMLRFLLENDELPLREALKLFEQTEGLKKGAGLFLFRYLIAKKELAVDMTKRIDLLSKVKDLLL